MQFISGILRTLPNFRGSGSARILFTNIPQRLELVRSVDSGQIFTAEMREPILVADNEPGTIVQSPGRGRPFEGIPAYVVNIREWHQEDRTSFNPNGGEMDEYHLDTNVTKEELTIHWNLGDNGAILEIGFVCAGR